MKLGLGTLMLAIALFGCGGGIENSNAKREPEPVEPMKDPGKPEDPGKKPDGTGGTGMSPLAGGAGGSISMGTGGAGGSEMPGGAGGSLPGTGGSEMPATGGSGGAGGSEMPGTGGAGGSEPGTGGTGGAGGSEMPGTGGAGGSSMAGTGGAGGTGMAGTGGAPVEDLGFILVANGPGGPAQAMPAGNLYLGNVNEFCGGNGAIKEALMPYRPSWMRWGKDMKELLALDIPLTNTQNIRVLKLDLTSCVLSKVENDSRPVSVAAYSGGLVTAAMPWADFKPAVPVKNDVYLNGVKVSDFGNLVTLDAGNRTVCWQTSGTPMVMCNDAMTMDKPVRMGWSASLMDVSASGNRVAVKSGSGVTQQVMVVNTEGMLTYSSKGATCSNNGDISAAILNPDGTKLVMLCNYPTMSKTYIEMHDAATGSRTRVLPWINRSATITDWR